MVVMVTGTERKVIYQVSFALNCLFSDVYRRTNIQDHLTV